MAQRPQPGKTDHDADEDSNRQVPPDTIVPPPLTKHLRVGLLVLIILLTIAFAIAVIIWQSPRHSIRGLLGFRGASGLSLAQRDHLKERQQALLRDPKFIPLVTRIVREKGGSPGFLGDCASYRGPLAALAASAAWDPKGQEMIFTMAGTEAADRNRMSALLDGLYEMGSAQKAESARLRDEQLNAAKRGVVLQSQMDDIDGQIKKDASLSARIAEHQG